MGIFHRRGIGRIRHLHTPLLWVQQKRAAKEIDVKKTPGKENPADMCTKHLSRAMLDMLLERTNVCIMITLLIHKNIFRY